MVEEADFISAEKELIPSVSLKELDHYKRVRAQFEKVEDTKAQDKPRSNGNTNGSRKGKGKAIDRKG